MVVSLIESPLHTTKMQPSVIGKDVVCVQHAVVEVVIVRKLVLGCEVEQVILPEFLINVEPTAGNILPVYLKQPVELRIVNKFLDDVDVSL